MAKLDDAYKAMLTKEEQMVADAGDDDAALAAFDAAEDEAASAAEAGTGEAEDDDTSTDEGDDGGDTPDTDADTDTDATDADAGDDDEDEDQNDEPEPVAAQAPQEEMPDLDAAAKALDEAKKERAAIQSQYQDGDLSDEDYEKKLDEVNDKIADARADIKTGERIQKRQQDEWLEAGRDYQKQYPDLFKPGMVQALDQAVAALTQIPSVASLPHSELLARAHRKMIAESEYTGLDVPPIRGKAAKAQKRKAPKGDDSLGKPPKTLARAPASDVAATGDESGYASLAKLNPVEMENALAKMPPAERDKFGAMNIEMG